MHSMPWKDPESLNHVSDPRSVAVAAASDARGKSISTNRRTPSGRERSISAKVAGTLALLLSWTVLHHFLTIAAARLVSSSANRMPQSSNTSSPGSHHVTVRHEHCKRKTCGSNDDCNGWAHRTPCSTATASGSMRPNWRRPLLAKQASSSRAASPAEVEEAEEATYKNCYGCWSKPAREARRGLGRASTRLNRRIATDRQCGVCEVDDGEIMLRTDSLWPRVSAALEHDVHSGAKYS